MSVCTALNRIAKSTDRRSACADPGLADLEGKLLVLFRDSSVQKSPQSIANSAWAVAKIGKGNRQLMDAIAEEALKKLHELRS